ncbi:hypothetical protein FOBRF1_005205 [Fusarium oxysporum]
MACLSQSFITWTVTVDAVSIHHEISDSLKTAEFEALHAPREAFPSRTGKDAGPQISNPLEGFFSIDANWSLNTPGRDRPRRRTPTPAAEGPDMSAGVLFFLLLNKLQILASLPWTRSISVCIVNLVTTARPPSNLAPDQTSKCFHWSNPTVYSFRPGGGQFPVPIQHLQFQMRT